MIKHFNKDTSAAYFDDFYDFKGQWDVPSRCGLKVVKNEKHTVIIATEIYADNPGTSVTNFCATLATVICNDFNIDHEKMIFIIRTPETGSKLTFMNENFYRVDFSWDGSKYTEPKWKEIDKDLVDELIGIKIK